MDLDRRWNTYEVNDVGIQAYLTGLCYHGQWSRRYYLFIPVFALLLPELPVTNLTLKTEIKLKMKIPRYSGLS